jgi:hypothetical protein
VSTKISCSSIILLVKTGADSIALAVVTLLLLLLPLQQHGVMPACCV